MAHSPTGLRSAAQPFILKLWLSAIYASVGILPTTFTIIIHYHFVYSVKYRRAVLEPEVVAELVRISQEIQQRYEIEIECLGADKDHIHLLCSAAPDLSPSEITRIYKSLMARLLFQALPSLRKRRWGGAFWGSGFFVETVGQRGNWQSLLRYIKKQGQKPEDLNLRLWYTGEPEEEA